METTEGNINDGSNGAVTPKETKETKDFATPPFLHSIIISPKNEEPTTPLSTKGELSYEDKSSLFSSNNATPSRPISTTSTPSKKEISTEDILDSLSLLHLRDLAIVKARTAVLFHAASKDHRYIRDKHGKNVVERPERLDCVRRAVNYLKTEAKDKLDVIECTRSPSLYDKHVLEVHDAIFIKNFESWCNTSLIHIKQNQPEIPSSVDPCGDLYVCPESIEAVRGCIGTLYSAIDSVCQSTPTHENAFAAVRPPGHHATCSVPMGFCFVNNITVGAMYAYRSYNIHRIAIVDIDLHHGNGTQEIVKKINHSHVGQYEGKELKMFYGSLHDILSYPCESGNEAAIEAASLCLMQHGQYIWNIHLEEFKNENEFWGLYNEQYRKLIDQVRKFFKGYPPQQCLLMISSGFDAHENEFKHMQRHHRKVVHGFYHKFTSELVDVARDCCGKKIVSVLEGGYSEAAVSQGATGHIGALIGLESQQCLLPTTPLQTRQSTRKSNQYSASTTKADGVFQTPSQKPVTATLSNIAPHLTGDMSVSPIKTHVQTSSQPDIALIPTLRKTKGKYQDRESLPSTTEYVESNEETVILSAMKNIDLTDHHE